VLKHAISDDWTYVSRRQTQKKYGNKGEKLWCAGKCIYVTVKANSLNNKTA